MTELFTLILQIGMILLVARIVGTMFRAIHQPQVVGEMAAGFLLGPSLLGWLAPHAFVRLFPPSSLGNLNNLSQIGLVLFMFLVGLSVHPKELREYGPAAIAAANASIATPFLMAVALSWFLYPRLSDPNVRFSHFALFLGAAMSITAFPVLARILTQRGLLGTPLGTLCIACAAVGDVVGWCMLAAIVVLVRSAHAAVPFWVTLVGSIAFVLIMVFGVRRLLRRLETHYLARGEVTENSISLIILFVLASGLTTEALGIHLLFGAFLAGSVMPKHGAFVRELQQKFESVTVVLLLPLYFAFTGLRTSLGLVKGAEMWGYCGAIIAVAVLGKLGGAMVAARAAGMPWRDSAELGILMNTRGLMELIILNIGLDIGVISPALFSMMVLMALVTTFMTTPLLNLVEALATPRAGQSAAKLPAAG
ncbi:MAG TPA: cation:proton antiporter [Bryobacteraceae bacterium]|jgi:Kef-type K+ transport system membrane component KefB